MKAWVLTVAGVTDPGSTAGVSDPGYRKAGLRQDFGHDLAVDVGEPLVLSVVLVSQLLVIEPHDVEDGRVQVVDVDLAFDRLEAELVGRAVDEAALDAAACKHGGEAVWVVVP